MTRRQLVFFSRTFGAVVLIGVFCGWGAILFAHEPSPVLPDSQAADSAEDAKSVEAAEPVEAVEAIEKPFIWPVPETFATDVPVKSNILRLSFPVSSGKTVDYVGCAQTLVKHVQREYGAGSPALIFYVVNLDDIQAQDLFAQEISRSFPDSAVIGAVVPNFFTRDGIISGRQAAIWFLGGADIRVSSVVVPLDSEQESSISGANLSRIERQTRLALRTDKDAAALIFYRNPAPDSAVFDWVKSWISGSYFDGVPTFYLPLSDSQSGCLYYGSKRYSRALIELIVSGTVSAEIKSIDNLTSGNPGTNHAAFAFSEISSNSDKTSTLQEERLQRSQLEQKFERLQKKIGKLTPLIFIYGYSDNIISSDNCLVLFPHIHSEFR